MASRQRLPPAKPHQQVIPAPPSLGLFATVDYCHHHQRRLNSVSLRFVPWNSNPILKRTAPQVFPLQRLSNENFSWGLRAGHIHRLSPCFIRSLPTSCLGSKQLQSFQHPSLITHVVPSIVFAPNVGQFARGWQFHRRGQRQGVRPDQ